MSKGRIEKDTGLTVRQKAFAEAYVRCGVGAQAAREAGYSPKRADQQANKLLQHEKVMAYIKGLQAKASDDAGVSIKQVIDEYALIAFADLSEFVEWGPRGVRLKESNTLDAARRRAIVEVRESATGGLSIKLADKKGALDSLGKHLGMFVDQVKHSGEVKTTAPIVNLTLTKG